MYRTPPVKLTPQEREALEYLRAHPRPYVLAQRIRETIVQDALERGWKGEKK